MLAACICALVMAVAIAVLVSKRTSATNPNATHLTQNTIILCTQASSLICNSMAYNPTGLPATCDRVSRSFCTAPNGCEGGVSTPMMDPVSMAHKVEGCGSKGSSQGLLNYGERTTGMPLSHRADLVFRWPRDLVCIEIRPISARKVVPFKRYCFPQPSLNGRRFPPCHECSRITSRHRGFEWSVFEREGVLGGTLRLRDDTISFAVEP